MSDEEIIMTREEMLKKLGAGEDPLAISIEKWERLVRWMKLNPDKTPDVNWYFTSTCALCKVYTSTCILGEIYKYGCSKCILYEIDCCLDKNSTWKQFANKPSIENAQKMLDVLKSVKE